MAISRIGQPRNAEVPDIPQGESPGFYAESSSQLAEAIQRLAQQIEETTRYVDEYGPTGNGATWLTSNVELQPQFENYSERIKYILVIGPPTAPFTLQLGDRFWNLTTPATGLLQWSADILLDRTHRRILSAATPGAWFLELTGETDVRIRPIVP